MPRIAVSILVLGAALVAQAGVTPSALRSDHLTSVSWRSVGPANMGGRITDLAVHPEKPQRFYVGAATGGVWKTVNGGTTFEPIFDRYGTCSIGALALAPSRPTDLWVGTGEAQARNSVTYGDGVYRSRDGGETWEHRGLRDSRHIGAIVVHPTEPDTVYVAALGRIWGPNSMRGLYKTSDGGETWSKVLAVDDNTGCIDVIFHPTDPGVVYAAAYEVRRDGFDGNDPAVRYGSRAGIYRSLDQGVTWTQCSGGLPTCAYGRIGLEICPAEPDWLFAVVETEYTGRPAPVAPDQEKGGPAYLGVRAEDRNGNGVLVMEVLRETGAREAGVQAGDLLTRIGDRSVRNYDDMMAGIRQFKSGDGSTVTIKRGEEELTLPITFGARRADRVPGVLGGQGANAVDRQGPTGFQTGGVYVSKDRGATFERVNSLTPRPFYYSQIRVDPTDPKFVWVLGTQLHPSTDGGKTFKDDGAPGIHVDHHAMWINPRDPRHLLLGNDGGLHVSFDRGKTWDSLESMPLGQFYGIALDNRRPYRIYGGLQDNGSWGFPSRVRSSFGLTHDHVFRIGSGDGFLCAVDPSDPDIVYSESQNGNLTRLNVATGQGGRVNRPGARSEVAGALGLERGPGGVRFRFNWETPFFLSPHNPHTLYWAGNRVIKSVDRGETSRIVSPEISRTSEGTASALAESPARQGVLWVGTDDGALWVSLDDGAEWKDVRPNLPPLARPLWVSHIEASRTDAGTAYVVLDGHRSDDFAPYVWRTRDFGATFEDLSNGLPPVSTRVLREDPTSPKLLWVGGETGVSVSVDAGATWATFASGLPVVRVDDIQIHPRDREVVVGTHGRSVWIADASGLQGLVGTLEDEVRLFAPKDATLWRTDSTTGRLAGRRYHQPTPSDGVVSYWLRDGVSDDTKMELVVEDVEGREIAELKPTRLAGLNEVRWDLRGRSPRSEEAGGRGARGGRGRSPVKPGTYRVKLTVGEREWMAAWVVLADPISQSSSSAGNP